jgi:hypothetical protein
MDSKRIVEAANARLLELMDEGHVDEARALAQEREWMSDAEIPVEVAEGLNTSYDRIVEALTPETTTGLHDVPSAKAEVEHIALWVRDWRE